MDTKRINATESVTCLFWKVSWFM